MDTVKLKPAVKSYIWGGTNLKKYGKESKEDIISETWELSFHDDGLSLVDSGIYKGKTLKEVAKKDDLGTNVSTFTFFPCLIKLIDSASPLSVQVHPSDEYALKNENSYGKTEMWYILDHEKDAGIYVGFKNNETQSDVEKALNNGTILDKLNFFKVKKGECYFIKSGTIHAIGKGVTLIEIQQNSNLTYRLYDYNRKDKNGNTRELHISKALKVIDYNKYVPITFNEGIIGTCKYFTSKKVEFKNEYVIENDEKSFSSITFIDGLGTVNDIKFKKYDTFFVPANKKAIIKGNGEFIITKV